jgi:type I toxin-antitoxin system toxin TisB
MATRKNLRLWSHFPAKPQKTKNPAGARFCQWLAGGIREAHCVTSTAKVYAIGGDRAISPTVYRVIEYETARLFCRQKHCSSIQHLSILKLFAVSHLGAACSTGAQKVLAETGGAVSALTPGRAHCFTSTTRLMTGSGKVNQPEVLLTLQEKRMGGMELAVLVLKLMVALLQLLDAVLKTFR